MLKLVEYSGGVAVLAWQAPEKDFYVLDFDGTDFRHERLMKFVSKANAQRLQEILDKHPDAQIVRACSHEPILTPYYIEKLRTKDTDWQKIADSQRVILEGKPYIDEFGYYVYVDSYLDLEGTMKDTDWRYEPEVVDWPVMQEIIKPFQPLT